MTRPARAKRKSAAARALVWLRDHPAPRKSTTTKHWAAVAMGRRRAEYPYDETHRLRWAGVPPEERSRQARKAVMVRWRRYRAAKKRQRSA